MKVKLSALFASATLFAASAFAQSWPARPVQVVAPFSPGGAADTLGRLAAQKLSDALARRPFILGGMGEVIDLCQQDSVLEKHKFLENRRHLCEILTGDGGREAHSGRASLHRPQTLPEPGQQDLKLV